MSTATANKLKTKDIITVVLLALINVVIFFASSVLYATPITIILMPVFFALLEGIVYFIIGTKVKKPGAILIYSIVRAIMGGYLPYIILFILSGVIAELLLWKMGYGNAKALTISYVINQVLAAFGSTAISSSEMAICSEKLPPSSFSAVSWSPRPSAMEARGAPPEATSAANAVTIMMMGMQTPTPVKARLPSPGICPI